MAEHMAALSLARRTLTTLGLGSLGPLPTCHTHTQTQDQATAPWAPGLLKTAPTTVPSGVSRVAGQQRGLGLLATRISPRKKFIPKILNQRLSNIL